MGLTILLRVALSNTVSVDLMSYLQRGANRKAVSVKNKRENIPSLTVASWLSVDFVLQTQWNK